MLGYARKGYGGMKDFAKIRSSTDWLNRFRLNNKLYQNHNNFQDNALPYLRSKQEVAVDDIIRSISRSPDSLLIAARLRETIQHFSHSSSTSTSKDTDMAIAKKLDTSVKAFLLGYCAPSNLVLKQITSIGTCSYAQDIITREEKNLSNSEKIPDLKTRLNTARRCYALFHRDNIDCMQPLSFVHVALTTQLMSRLEDIDNLDSRQQRFTHATFYSINSCFDVGLRGVGISNHLIIMTKKTLFDQNNFLRVASTLSPIPGFNQWLSGISLNEKLSPAHQQMVTEAIGDIEADKLENSQFNKLAYLLQTNPKALLLDEARAAKLKEPLRYLCAIYLSKERKSIGVPLDRVARFHLGNGAELGRINWLADTRSKALENGSGMMANYIYNDNFLEKNRAGLINENVVEMNYSVREILGVEQRATKKRFQHAIKKDNTTKPEDSSKKRTTKIDH